MTSGDREDLADDVRLQRHSQLLHELAEFMDALQVD
jgi:hypothetical protein